MSSRTPHKALLALLCACLGLRALGEDLEIRNWVAPPYWNWTPPVQAPAPEERGENPAPGRTALGRTALAGGPTALPFISLLPCRLVDTRGNAPLTGGFLPPATVRSYTLTGVCNVPANAQAISLNVTVVHPTGPGFITLYPQGGSFPPVSTLNYLGNDVIVNAAVVPLSATGGISMALGVSGGDVVLDTNGYYAQTPTVTGLNTLTGDVTLSAGTNVTITPSGNTLTISSTGGSGGPPTGAAGGSLSGTYPNPGIADGAVTDAKIAGVSFGKVTGVPGYVLKSGDTMSGSLTLSAGNLVLGVEPSAGSGGSIVKGGKPYLHDTGDGNTFLGLAAGYGAVLGGAGGDNTGVGWGALQGNSVGLGNTAVGGLALYNNSTGTLNTAVGSNALGNNTTGYRNIGIGPNGGNGSLLTTGSDNIAIGSPGVAGESSTIRVGRAAFQTRAFLSGIRGVTTGASDGLPVFVDSNGQLGTAGGTITATGFSGSLAGDVTGTQPATVVAQVGGQPATNVAAGAVAANAAASANTPSTIVKRDASGNFSAGTITGALTGAASANVLKTGDTMSGSLTLSAGNIELPSVSSATGGNITKGGNRLLHTFGNTANVFVGIDAGNFSMTGAGNTAVGGLSLTYNAGGRYNTAVGYHALNENISGDSNVAMGYWALANTTSGSQNTALGHYAGHRSGAGTGYSGGAITFVEQTTGSYNTFLGQGTGATASVSNCTAVGIDAYCDANDQVRLGNFYVSSIGGKVGWSALSDARAKEDIRDLDAGLDLVLKLRPVAYRLKGGNGRTDMGFLAQDVEAVLGEGFGVVTAGGDPDRTLSLRYQDFIAPLVKAVQEQQATIEKDRQEIRELKARLERLEALLANPVR